MKTLKDIEGRVANTKEGAREDMAYYLVREMFKNAGEDAIARWAEAILARTGR